MKYNLVDEPKSVCVITPTVGSEFLSTAIESVAIQSYDNVKHLVVLDGLNDRYREVLDIVSEYDNTALTVAPTNTGKNGFYGHRIYAAYPHLIDADYILFLDEDNWYSHIHVESLVNLIEKEDLDWAFSFRGIQTKDEKFVSTDNCESIGKWPVFWSQGAHPTNQEFLVDTSTYCFKREFLINVCHNWHWGWGADRRFFNKIKDISKFNTTTTPTLAYRLDDNIEHKYGSIDFFEKGNQSVLDYYGGKYPWQ